jgi:hypothetical protein
MPCKCLSQIELGPQWLGAKAAIKFIASAHKTQVDRIARAAKMGDVGQNAGQLGIVHTKPFGQRGGVLV